MAISRAAHSGDRLESGLAWFDEGGRQTPGRVSPGVYRNATARGGRFLDNSVAMDDPTPSVLVALAKSG